MALLDQAQVDKVITVVQDMVLMALCHLEVLEEAQAFLILRVQHRN